MKYKLINKQTNEEHLCDKVTIDGFDYYVSDEKLIPNCYVFDPIRNRITVIYLVSKKGENFGAKKVIATNNPNIDIPQILEEPNETLIHQIAADLGYRMLPDDLEEGIKAGYKESQETHPFSEQDMIDFVLWKDENKFSVISTKEDWVSELLEYSGCVYTTKELLQLWQEQQPKIVYYE